jgi:lysophospholipase L1-like esterase
MSFTRRLFLVVMLAGLAAACSGDSNTPMATLAAPTSPGAVPMSCPPAMAQQSVDALPVTMTWSSPTLAGITVDRSSCAPTSGTAFPIGTSTVTCTSAEPTYASACSFDINITPPDPKLRFTRFLAFGDSITAGFVSEGFSAPGSDPLQIPAMLRAAGGRGIAGISRAVQPLNAYPAVLQNLLAPAYMTQRFTVANEGRSGEKVAEGAARLRSTLLATQPEVMMLFEGFNDIDLALFEAGPNNTSAIDVRSIAAELRWMVNTAEGLGVEVLLATLTPTTAPREASDPGTRASIEALNDEIRAMPPTLGRGGVIDLYSMLDGVPGVIGPDGFHPTSMGYRRIGEVFFSEIVNRHDVTPRAPSATRSP